MMADLPPVVINEIAWMGTANSANDEWIELYNNTDTAINLEGWNLKNIKLISTIPAQGFYLLERTDDSTVPQIAADQIYTGALGNKGEKLELYNNTGNLIDFIDASPGWPAGDNTTKQTMERIASGWQTSQNTGGTPKAENVIYEVKLSESTTEKTDEAEPLSLAATEKNIKPFFESVSVNRQTPILIALATAVFSGIMILILKKKLI